MANTLQIDTMYQLLIQKEYFTEAEFLEKMKEVSVTFVCGRKQITSHVGNLLFTRVGISGPIILSISGKVIDWLTDGKKVVASVDLSPSLSREEIDTQLMKDIIANSKKSISNVLKKNLPSRLVDIAMEVLEIIPGKQVSQLTSKNRKKIVSFLKGMNLKIIGVSSFEKAMITRGGISLKEINPKTMASRKINGLFFAGEMIDLDGDTGGYNLQEAFSTGISCQRVPAAIPSSGKPNSSS